MRSGRYARCTHGVSCLGADGTRAHCHALNLTGGCLVLTSKCVATHFCDTEPENAQYNLTCRAHLLSQQKLCSEYSLLMRRHSSATALILSILSRLIIYIYTNKTIKCVKSANYAFLCKCGALHGLGCGGTRQRMLRINMFAAAGGGGRTIRSK